ncbi:MAG: NAD-dependent epimerase/dehydratase family protein, partial [Proteobacteria bacterium]
MHVILGASGHVGSALTNQLLMKNEEVLVITHSPEKQKEWQDKGA